MKYGPVLLALAAVLAAGTIAFFRKSDEDAPVRRPPPGSSADALPADPGSTPGSQLPTPPAAKPAPRGSLRVTLVGSDASIDGSLIVLDERLQREAASEAKGSGRLELRIDKLSPGSKTLVYAPEGSVYLAASLPARVEAEAAGEALMTLQAAAALTGVAVDSLQRPLPGVTLTVHLPQLFPSTTPGNPDYPVWSRHGGRSRGRGRVMVTESFSLLADGRVSRSVSTDQDGGFELTGLSAGAFTFEVAYKDVRFSQACVVGGENRIVVPVVFETPIPDLREELFQKKIVELLRQIALHPEAPEPYAAPLREMLHGKVDAANVSNQERASLKKLIEEIGRPSPKSPGR